MQGKKKSLNPGEKLIGGKPHRRAPCEGCGEPIWVSVRAAHAYCTECSGVDELRSHGGTRDRAWKANKQYHGDSGEY